MILSIYSMGKRNETKHGYLKNILKLIISIKVDSLDRIWPTSSPLVTHSMFVQITHSESSI